MEQDFALNIFADLGDNGCDSGNSGGSREPSIYVFGYGSLVWNPGFEFSKCITGCEFAFLSLDDFSLIYFCSQISADTTDAFGKATSPTEAQLIR